MTPKPPDKRPPRYWTGRLNVLLRFVRVDPWKLSDGALKALVDEMYSALVNDQDRQDFPPAEFGAIATREALSKAQRELGRALDHLLTPCEMPLRTWPVKLTGQELIICSISNSSFWTIRKSADLPSVVFNVFAELLKESGVKPKEFLHCSRCNDLFVPLREPVKGTPSYCSPKCANVIASKSYRERQAAARLKKKKVREKWVKQGKKAKAQPK